MLFVSAVLAVLLAIIVAGTRSRPALALGAVQLLIGIAAASVYYFQDKVPTMFAYLAMVATGQCDSSRPLALSPHIATIQTMSFVIALLCALPPALGMGATRSRSPCVRTREAWARSEPTPATCTPSTPWARFSGALLQDLLLPWVGMETAFYIAVTVNLALGLLLMLTAPGDEPAKYVLVPVTAVLLAIAATGAVLGREGRLSRSQGRFAVFPKPWNQKSA